MTRTTCVASQIPFPPTTLSLLVLQAMTSMAEVCERYHRITINVVLNSNNFTAYYILHRNGLTTIPPQVLHAQGFAPRLLCIKERRMPHQRMHVALFAKTIGHQNIIRISVE